MKPHGMTQIARRLLAVLVFGTSLNGGLLANSALAQDYPSRPVTVVIPFTAGGPADTAARTISEVLRHHLGQSVIAENRPAASGVTGTEAVALGEPDGYTLLLGGIAALVLIPPVQKVRYDVEKDFVPLGLIWRSPQVFAVRPALGVRTVAEFVTYAKARPGKVAIGSAGNGTVTHLAGEVLKRESGSSCCTYRTAAQPIRSPTWSAATSMRSSATLRSCSRMCRAARSAPSRSRRPSARRFCLNSPRWRRLVSRACGPRSGMACSHPRARQLRCWNG